MTAEQAVEVGADLVAFALTKSMALSASSLEEVGTLLCVTYIKCQCQPSFARSPEKCCRKCPKIPHCDKLSQTCSEHVQNISTKHVYPARCSQTAQLDELPATSFVGQYCLVYMTSSMEATRVSQGSQRHLLPEPLPMPALHKASSTQSLRNISIFSWH